MKVINKPQKSALTLAKDLVKDEKMQYRPFTFLTSRQVDDGTLLYNVMTGEFILLEGKEEQLWNALKEGSVFYDSTNETFAYLIEHYYACPIDTDDRHVVDALFEKMKFVYSAKEPYPTSSLDGKLNGYTIFTTTECNARCFYCYEVGCEKISISPKVAQDIVKFIDRTHKPDKTVNLHWFGGEPLYNLEAIDVICKGLQKRNIKYRSSIISNTLLFTEDVVKKAVDLWKLTNVQVTLDGTKDVYNKVKAYVDGPKDAFSQVIKNTHALANVGISVNIRLNCNAQNTKELMKLTDFLADEFKDDANVSTYSRIIIKEKDSPDGKELPEYKPVSCENPSSDPDKREFLRLQRYLRKSKVMKGRGSLSSIRLNACMADSASSVAIVPDGRLISCEHFLTDTISWGTIYDDITNVGMKQSWNTPIKLPQECSSCWRYPQCYVVQKCPWSREVCALEDRIDYTEINQTLLKRSYECYLEKEKEDAEKECSEDESKDELQDRTCDAVNPDVLEIAHKGNQGIKQQDEA